MRLCQEVYPFRAALFAAGQRKPKTKQKAARPAQKGAENGAASCLYTGEKGNILKNKTKA